MIKICRLLFTNRKGYNLLEEKYGAKKMMDYLEKQCGGSGMGFITTKDNHMYEMDKGLKLTNSAIAESMAMSSFDYFIYHTRVPSAGGVTDKNCHPYWNDSNTFAICMNGTESGFAALARGKNVTDTELIYHMINKRIIGVEDLTALSANYMGFKKDHMFVINNGSGFNGLEFYEEDGAIIIASSFPPGFKLKTKDMEIGLWVQDTPIQKKTYKVYTESGYESYGKPYRTTWSMENSLPKKTKGTDIITYPEDDDYKRLVGGEILTEAEYEAYLEEEEALKREREYFGDYSSDDYYDTPSNKKMLAYYERTLKD